MKDIRYKTCESELIDGWKKERDMQESIKYNYVGKVIAHVNGKMYCIKECLGTNIKGFKEYYVEPYEHVGHSKYITESEIVYENSKSESTSSTDNVDLPDLPCSHVNKYENVISKSMRFWVCSDCKKEVPPTTPLEEDLRDFFWKDEII